MTTDPPEPSDGPLPAPPTSAAAGEASRGLAVGAGDAGLRLDRWLAGRFAGALSRARLQSLIAAGAVSVDGRAVSAPSRKVAVGEVVAVRVPEAAEPDPQPEAIPLAVLHEDDDLIVLNKPAGLVVHPGAGNPSGTLVNALLHHCGASLSGIGGVKRPGIVHRLDKDTSGVLVAAKNDRAHRGLSEQFAAHGRDGRLERSYLAIAWGVPARAAGTVDAALGRSGADRLKREVVPDTRADARRAVTHYAVLRAAPDAAAALVACALETGRTHQIRVHLAHLGHPLVGDPLYGRAFRTKARRLDPAAAAAADGFARQALHARTLGFRHPATGAALRFEAPPPADMAELAAALGLLPLP